MASNKGKRGLDKSAGSALSALDWALSQTIEKPQQADEFTGDEFFEKMAATETELRREACRMRLRSLVDQGMLSVRSIIIGGRRRNLYSKP